jgi:hypothetical protein
MWEKARNRPALLQAFRIRRIYRVTATASW